MKQVRFTTHAENKFKVLNQYGINISREHIINILTSATHVVDGYKGRKVAQGDLDQDHILRIIFEELKDEMVVVTFYPARREQYEGAI